ncbi:hypothetical protein CDAR_252161 [Caerostris darwini]|uniref:Uncharacterized protein n=1 Tax=Caerostris darwini TaxID=1538125 RepID=A0AAV4QDI5_9ARAC|nr:hypothetical protein CDAR_252161 [Caerostris darwini]
MGEQPTEANLVTPNKASNGLLIEKSASHSVTRDVLFYIHTINQAALFLEALNSKPPLSHPETKHQQDGIPKKQESTTQRKKVYGNIKRSYIRQLIISAWRTINGIIGHIH